MNDLIDKISEKFKNHCPNVEFRVENKDELFINPKNKNGFEIFIQHTKRENTIYFNSWHFHFENTKDGKNELLDYLGFGMSKLGRLKTYLRFGKEYKWVFETLNEQNGNWYSAGTTGLINLYFWKKPEIKYYQNDLINLNETNKI